MAGMSAAWHLRRSGHDVVVFEKSRGLSGRAATRRRGNICYDHGANFFRTDDPEFEELIHQILPTDDLVEIKSEVWTFDHSGRPIPGDPEQNAKAKYSYRHGISTIGKLLAADAKVDVRRQTRIHKLERIQNVWKVYDEDDCDHGDYTDVILTSPAAQSSAILRSSILDEKLCSDLCNVLDNTAYEPQFTFVLGYSYEWIRGGPYHALLNLDRQHDVAWLSFEQDKPGHVPDGEAVLIAQMSANWTSTHYETQPADLIPTVIKAVRSILPEAPNPDWWDSQRWRYARPTKAIDQQKLRAAETSGLYFAGDVIYGKGRIPLAVKSGLETAIRIIVGGA